MVQALLVLLALLLIEPFAELKRAWAAEALAPPMAGPWSGEWRTQNGSAYGSMEFEIEVKDEQVAGRAKAAIRGDCSNQWEPIGGVMKDGKVLASYNLGGRCGKVNLILSLESDGTMTGTWRSEFPRLMGTTIFERKRPLALSSFARGLTQRSTGRRPA